MSKQLDLLNKYNDDRTTDEEKSQLLRMLSRSELWDEEFDTVWNQSFMAMNKSMDRRILNMIHKAAKPRHSFPWKFCMQVASCIIILISTVVSIYFWNENVQLTQYADMSVEVSKGQKTDVILPDGTKVFINSDSQLCYGKDFNGKIRKVSLKGEAYFQVAKDTNAPFMVMVGNLEVKALGTSFNIKAYPNDDMVNAYLQEGIIEIKSAQEKMILNPGESISYVPSTGEIYRKEIEERQSSLAWLKNEMYFDDEPLTEIIKQLERQYNVNLLIKDENLKLLTYSGTLKTSSLQSALEALITTSPRYLGYRNIPNGIELYSK